MFASSAVQHQLSEAGFVFDEKTARYFYRREPVWTKQEHLASGRRQGAFPVETVAEFFEETRQWLASLKKAQKSSEEVEEEPRTEKKKKRKTEEEEQQQQEEDGESEQEKKKKKRKKEE
jgi:hypothetical protein